MLSLSLLSLAPVWLWAVLVSVAVGLYVDLAEVKMLDRRRCALEGCRRRCMRRHGPVAVLGNRGARRRPVAGPHSVDPRRFRPHP